MLSLVQAWLATERLRVDAEGIRVRPSRVPWSQIREVVVFGGNTLGLRLKPGAPVPRGVRGMIDGGLRLPSLFTLDRDRLTRAVAAYGGGTPIVEENAAYSDAGGSFSGSPGSGASSSSSSAGGPSG